MNVLGKVFSPRGRSTLYHLNRFVTRPEAAYAYAYSTGNPPKDHRLVTRADPKIGVCFKNLFRKNKKLLVDFLNDVLREKKAVVSVHFKIPDLFCKEVNARKGIVDMACKMEDGSFVIVDLRMNNEDDSREAVYDVSEWYSWSGQKVKKDEDGEDFRPIIPVIFVTITDHDVLPAKKDQSFYSRHAFVDVETKQEFPFLKWVHIELSKFIIDVTDVQKIQTNTELWAFLLKYASIMSEEHWEALIAKKKVLQTARDALDMSRWNKTKKLAYFRATMKPLCVHDALAVQRMQIARNMLRHDWDEATVCEVTKLKPKDLVDLEDLEELQPED